MMKKDNRGYSLIELLIVIAIIVVLCSALVLSTGIITRSRQKKVIRSVYTAVGQTRVSTLARDDCKVVLWKDADGTFVETYDNGVSREKKLIAPPTITVYYSGAEDYSGETELTSGTTLECKFNRASGVVDSSDFYMVRAGDYNMKLVKQTGKCTWNQ